MRNDKGEIIDVLVSNISEKSANPGLVDPLVRSIIENYRGCTTIHSSLDATNFPFELEVPNGIYKIDIRGYFSGDEFTEFSKSAEISETTTDFSLILGTPTITVSGQVTINETFKTVQVRAVGNDGKATITNLENISQGSTQPFSLDLPDTGVAYIINARGTISNGPGTTQTESEVINVTGGTSTLSLSLGKPSISGTVAGFEAAYNDNNDLELYGCIAVFKDDGDNTFSSTDTQTYCEPLNVDRSFTTSPLEEGNYFLLPAVDGFPGASASDLITVSGSIVEGVELSLPITAATAVTAVTISASPLKGLSDSTMTVVATYTTALVAADTITVKLAGYTLTAGAVTVTAGTGVTGTLIGTVVAGATDTLVIKGAVVAAGSSATFTFPVIHPDAGVIATTALKIHTSKDGTPVDSTAGFTITAATAVTGVTVSASPLFANSASVMTVVFRAKKALTAGDTITVKLTGYTLTAGTVVVTPGTGITAGTGAKGRVPLGSSTTLVYTLGTGGAVAAGANALFTFPVTNPAVVGTIASSGLTLYTSKDRTPVASGSAIVIAAAPVKSIAFTGAYSTTVEVGKAFPSQPQVTFYNGTEVDTNNTGTVSLTVKSSLPAGGRLTGTASVAAVAGVAKFSGLSFDQLGVYVLSAAATGYTSINTNSIPAVAAGSVTTNKLTFLTQPTDILAGTPFSIQVAAKSTAGITNPGESGLVTLSSPGFTSRILPFVGGLAQFNNLVFNAPGSYRVTATSGALTTTSLIVTVTEDVAMKSTSTLYFSKYPKNVATTAQFTVQLGIRDQNGVVDIAEQGTVVSFKLGKTGTIPTTSVLTCDDTTFNNGVAQTNCEIIGADTALYLEASAPGFDPVSSCPFIVYATAAAAATAQAVEQTQSDECRASTN